jgi:hypothetical protein
MTTTPEPVDDSYPDAWKPRERVQRDDELEPLAVEAFIASLSPAELQSLLTRARNR